MTFEKNISNGFFALIERATLIDIETTKFEACWLSLKFHDKNESARI